MGRVLTNNVGLSYTIESSLGTAGTTWFQLEPNEISSFGAEITTVARDPISQNRQRRKGTTTDLDSGIELAHDLTLSAFRDFIEGFVFATGVNTDVTELDVDSAETTGDTYTLATALVAGQNVKLVTDATTGDSLIWVTGAVNAANNGLKSIATDTTTNTTVAVNENLVDETLPSTARLSFAGHRVPSGSTPAWTYSAPQATLSGVTGLGTQLAASGLTVGQIVHIGSVASAGSTTIQNAFGGDNSQYGYARVVTINADSVVFDKLSTALQATDASLSENDLDIVFGNFVRNVAVSNSAYLERSFQFEAEFPNLDTGGGSEFQYSIGNYCNQASFALPLSDKATVTFGFVGTDTEDPVVAASRKSGASSAAAPLRTTPYNTTADIARLRITQTDETGLTTDFKSLTLTLNNNVSPEKVLGQLGAAYMNTGNFEVNIEAQLVFTDGAVINAIRGNTTLTMDFVLKNDESVIAVDVPSLTLGGGEREFPRNESVLVNVTATAFQDDSLGTSIGVSIIPVPIP